MFNHFNVCITLSINNVYDNITSIVAVRQPDQGPVDGAPEFPALAGCLLQVVAGAVNGPVLNRYLLDGALNIFTAATLLHLSQVGQAGSQSTVMAAQSGLTASSMSVMTGWPAAWVGTVCRREHLRRNLSV